MVIPSRAQLVRIEASIPWHVAYDQSSETWYGVCHVLNLNAVGDTLVEMQQCADEALQLLFTDLFEDNELDRFMALNGWTYRGSEPLRGIPARFDVPIEVLQQSGLRGPHPRVKFSRDQLFNRGGTRWRYRFWWGEWCEASVALAQKIRSRSWNVEKHQRRITLVNGKLMTTARAKTTTDRSAGSVQGGYPSPSLDTIPQK